MPRACNYSDKLWRFAGQDLVKHLPLEPYCHKAERLWKKGHYGRFGSHKVSGIEFTSNNVIPLGHMNIGYKDIGEPTGMAVNTSHITQKGL